MEHHNEMDEKSYFNLVIKSTIIDFASTGFMWVEENGRIRFASKNAARIIYSDFASLEGRFFEEAFADENAQKKIEEFLTKIRQNETFSGVKSLTVRIRNQYEEWVPVWVRVKRWPSKRKQGFLIELMDIEEIKEFEKEVADEVEQLAIEEEEAMREHELEVRTKLEQEVEDLKKALSNKK